MRIETRHGILHILSRGEAVKEWPSKTRLPRNYDCHEGHIHPPFRDINVIAILRPRSKRGM